MLRLRDIMTRDVVAVSPEMPLDELAELFTARHIGGAPVLAGQKVVGVVSATDLLTFAAAPAAQTTIRQEEDETAWAGESGRSPLEEEEVRDGYFTGEWDITNERVGGAWGELTDERRDSLGHARVADVMSTAVLSLGPETGVTAAADFMRRKGVHRVLVISDGVLEGIVTSMNIVDAVAKQQIASPQVVYPYDADFDAGWSHEPVVPDTEPYPVRGSDGYTSSKVARYLERDGA